MSYIRVILPLALPWEPVYCTDAPVAVGDRIRVVLTGRSYVGVVSETDATPEIDPSKIRPAGEPEPGLEPVSAEEIRFWRELADYYLCTVGEVYKAAYPVLRIRSEEIAARVRERMEKRLEKTRGQQEKARKEETRSRYAALVEKLERALQEGLPAPCEAVDRPVLSPAQEAAASGIRSAFALGSRTVLLKGGPERDAVLTTLVADTLSEGRGVLYLVPDIALSRQLESQWEARFPGLLTYHSGETATRRSEISAQLRSGVPSLVLGTRSALLLPCRNLGLIVLDDEHDTYYKQDSPAPRYHAREAAILLAGITGARVILASATPTLESLYNAAAGRFARIDLPVSDANSVPIELIDTRDEQRKRGMSGHFSFKLTEAIHQNLLAGGKTILICPRRSIYTGPEPIEAEARGLFPEARIARLDADATPAQWKQTLDDFAEGDTQLLIGPQAVMKGFGTKDLRLVALIQGDSLLHSSDFRADERALQILERLRLQAGGNGAPCRLIIQTAQSNHPVLRSFADTDTDGLRKTILEERTAFGYPPATRLIQIILRDENEKRLALLTDALLGALRASFPGIIDLPGPQETVRHLRLTLPRDKKLRETKRRLAEAIALFEKERKYPGHIQIDVDPV